MTDRDYLRLAYQAAAKLSHDPDTKNGSILVSGGQHVVGANRFPDGVRVLPHRVQRPAKYGYMEHAERDVIYRAIKQGLETAGSTMYCPYIACADCARAIIIAGVIRVVGHKQLMAKLPERWRESVLLGDLMLDEAGIQRDYYVGMIGDVEHTFDGGIWRP
jgi:dCMP deaminase